MQCLWEISTGYIYALSFNVSTVVGGNSTGSIFLCDNSIGSWQHFSRSGHRICTTRALAGDVSSRILPPMLPWYMKGSEVMSGRHGSSYDAASVRRGAVLCHLESSEVRPNCHPGASCRQRAIYTRKWGSKLSQA